MALELTSPELAQAGPRTKLAPLVVRLGMRYRDCPGRPCNNRQRTAPPDLRRQCGWPGRIALLESTIDDYQKAGCGDCDSARGQRPSASKPISQCAARATGVRGNKCQRYRHAGDNNCNYAVGERRHTTVAADPAATDALCEHNNKRSRDTTCEPERIWVVAWRRRHHGG